MIHTAGATWLLAAESSRHGFDAAWPEGRGAFLDGAVGQVSPNAEADDVFEGGWASFQSAVHASPSEFDESSASLSVLVVRRTTQQVQGCGLGGHRLVVVDAETSRESLFGPQDVDVVGAKNNVARVPPNITFYRTLGLNRSSPECFSFPCGGGTMVLACNYVVARWLQPRTLPSESRLVRLIAESGYGVAWAATLPCPESATGAI